MLELTIRDKRKFIGIQAVIPAIRVVGGDEQEFSDTLTHRVSLRPCLKTESRGSSTIAVFLHSARSAEKAEAQEVRKEPEVGNCRAAGHGGSTSATLAPTRLRQEGLLRSQGQPGMQREILQITSEVKKCSG